MSRHRDADIIDLAAHLGRVVSRENSATKARRYLIEGRLIVERVSERGVLAKVRSDGGRIYEVMYYGGSWECDCPARGDCAHIRATKLVVAVDL